MSDSPPVLCCLAELKNRKSGRKYKAAAVCHPLYHILAHQTTSVAHHGFCLLDSPWALRLSFKQNVYGRFLEHSWTGFCSEGTSYIRVLYAGTRMERGMTDGCLSTGTPSPPTFPQSCPSLALLKHGSCCRWHHDTTQPASGRHSGQQMLSVLNTEIQSTATAERA